MPSEAIQCKPLEVVVSDRGIERAIKMLKRKLASEGVLRELKMRRHYMKPSVKRRKKQAEAARRRRKRAKVEAAPPVTKERTLLWSRGADAAPLELPTGSFVPGRLWRAATTAVGSFVPGRLWRAGTTAGLGCGGDGFF